MLEHDFFIAERQIGAGNSPYVIAEIGSNFDQSMDTACALIDVAADCSCDAVKFQLFKADALYPGGGEMYDTFKSIELDAGWLHALKAYSSERGLHFLVSAFDKGSVKALCDVGVPAFKVASSELTNFSLLHQIAASGMPLILATGMCDMVDVEEAVAVCEGAGNHNVALLQCGSMYPLPAEMVNLNVMKTFKNRFKCPVGFSDHTLGVYASIASAALGASVIEKHITLDKKSKGPDHFYALEPHELKALVEGIHESYMSLGSFSKNLLPEERKVGRRDGLYAAHDIAKGDIITANDVVVRRPALGLRGRYLTQVVGAKASNDITKDQPMDWSDIEF